MQDATQVAAVILAAGSSTRFGSPKQLARVGERTMLDTVVELAVAAELRPIMAVVPPGIAVPAAAIPVINDRPQEGLSRSLRLGTEALPPETAAAVILLGDQPTLSLATIRAVVAARGQRPIVAARANDLFAPPVLLERSQFGLAEQTSEDTGLRAVLAEHPELVSAVEVDAHPPDVDTPEDLERLAAAQPAAADADAIEGQRERLRRALVDAAARVERIGDWPVPLVVAHLARWDAVAAHELRAYFAGQATSDYTDYESWNRRWAAEDDALSMEAALARWDDAFRQVIDLVRRVPEERWDRRAMEWLNGCTVDHHADHLAALSEAAEDRAEHGPPTARIGRMFESGSSAPDR